MLKICHWICFASNIIIHVFSIARIMSDCLTTANLRIVLSWTVCCCSCCCCRCHVYIGARRKNGRCMYVAVHCVHSNNKHQQWVSRPCLIVCEFRRIQRVCALSPNTVQTYFMFLSSPQCEHTVAYHFRRTRARFHSHSHRYTAHKHTPIILIQSFAFIYRSVHEWDVSCCCFFFYSIPFVIVMSAINVISYPKSIMTYTSIEFVCSHSIRD